jgi:hypothetical protein
MDPCEIMSSAARDTMDYFALQIRESDDWEARNSSGLRREAVRELIGEGLVVARSEFEGSSWGGLGSN